MVTLLALVVAYVVICVRGLRWGVYGDILVVYFMSMFFRGIGGGGRSGVSQDQREGWFCGKLYGGCVRDDVRDYIGDVWGRIYGGL